VIIDIYFLFLSPKFLLILTLVAMKKLVFVAFMAISLSAAAQLGIGTTSPHPSAQLDVASTSKGFLPPRMTYNERNAIGTGATGLMVWCTDCGPKGEMQVFNGTSWTNMTGGPATPPPPPGLGDFYEGGIIFYFLQSGDPGYIEGESHGYIADTVDLGIAQWGCQYSTIGTATSLNSRAANTAAIVAACLTSGIAARLCSDAVHNGFDDWYLPSKDELNKLYLNNTYIGGLSNEYYWSSSEQNLDNAWYRNPLYGWTDYNPKS